MKFSPQDVSNGLPPMVSIFNKSLHTTLGMKTHGDINKRDEVDGVGRSKPILTSNEGQSHG